VLYNTFVLVLDKEAQCGKFVHRLRFISFVQQFASQLMLDVDCAFRMVGNSLNSLCRSSVPHRSNFSQPQGKEGSLFY